MRGKPAVQSQSKSKNAPPAAWRERLSHDQYQGLRDVFLVFDDDGSGTIDPQQIVKALEEVGLNQRNPFVHNIIVALRQTNKILNFDEFVDVVCSQIGQYKTKDGLRRVFKLYDKEDTGILRFDQLKAIAHLIGQTLDDDALLELMHAVFINNKTESNEEFTFDDFYLVISKYYARGQV